MKCRLGEKEPITCTGMVKEVVEKAGTGMRSTKEMEQALEEETETTEQGGVLGDYRRNPLMVDISGSRFEIYSIQLAREFQESLSFMNIFSFFHFSNDANFQYVS